MKRRLSILLALVLLVSVVVGVLAGCGRIFVKAEDRDAAQVVATVTYNGQTATVTKAELTVSFNNYAYLYNAYYGLTYQEAADTILRSLAQNKLLVLFAKDEIAKANGDSRHAADIPVYELLSGSELNRAVENVNDDMLSALSTALESLINEADYNESDDSETEEEKYEEYKGDDAVRVYFDTDGGSTVERQSIKKGTKAFEPEEPTKEGYTFLGWFTAKGADATEWDFAATVEKTTTLYAHWEKYTAPRTERPEVEEDEDKDYDPDAALPEGTVAAVRFFLSDGTFNDAYKTLVYDRTAEPEVLADYNDEDYKKALDDHLADAVKQVQDNLSSSYLSYDYYLNAEYESLLITRLERMIGDGRIGDGATVTADEVQKRFDALVAQNKETFKDGESYQSAIESSLSTTYYHKEGYGFVINILLQLPEEDIEELTALIADGTVTKEHVKSVRDSKLAALQVNVSNPDYDADYECKDENCDHETVTVTEGSAGLKQIVEFKQDADTKEWGVVYNVSMCPSVAYLPDKIAALGADGIIEQIYTSLGQVRAAVESKAITHVQGLYWMREVATAWLYIVGDDSGSVTADSNNNGLGYVVTPKGEESGYIDSFTEQARALIANGGGSYVRDVDGGATLNNFYVYGDNFIDSDTAVDASSAYAGIFVLVASYVPYDKTGWGSYTVTYDEETDTYGEAKIADGAYVDGVLPMDYVITHAAELSDCVTVRQSIEDGLLAKKKAALYEKKVNDFGVANYGNITYNEKAYKSLWKGLD